MLIFDSGVGGLFVLNIIRKILPNIRYIYILDNEAFPYGNKTEFFIIQRSIKIISTIKKKYPITLAVVACNTVSTVAISILRKKFNFPIIGIFPEIKTAQKTTKNKIIGLIATKATINSFYIKKTIYKQFSYNNIKIIGTNKLAVIAEKKIRGIVDLNKELKNIFEPWMNLSVPPDTIILGCTHFSFLKEEIKKILNTSQFIYFIDSTETVVFQIKKYFNKSTIIQNIKKNIFLYSQKNSKELKLLWCFLEKYKFKKIKYINLN